MSRKKIIIILLLLVVFFTLLIVLIMSKKKNKNNSTSLIQNAQNQSIVENCYKDFKTEFTTAIEECKRLYKKMNYNNFDICFNLATIDVNLQNYSIRYADISELYNLNVYNENGVYLENGLDSIVKDVYLENNYITYNQNYFIYAYSKEEKLTLFCTLLFSENGDADINLIAYTDEFENIDEENNNEINNVDIF